ncbi:MAG: serine hydrolase [Agathobacter sp.]
MTVLITIILMFIQQSISAQSIEMVGKDGQSDNYGACLYADGKAKGYRIDEPFAMHSIMKFPQTIYVAECLYRSSIPLKETITIRKAELIQNTWSPMLKMFDEERDFSYAELLKLSLAQSDNNACDILFKHFGGPEKVEDYLHKKGFKEIHIKWTEREMGINPGRAADNNCTPRDMARLLEWFYKNKEQNEYLGYVWETMANCQTGTERISSIIPEGSVFVHKTGTGFPSKDKKQDRNDAGVIIMPNGTHQVIAVFAPQSIKESDVATIGKRYIYNK